MKPRLMLSRVKLKLTPRPLLAWVICLELILSPPGITRASDPPLTLEDYWQQVESTYATILRLENQSAEAVRTQLQAEADRWEHITALTLPDGTQAPLDHSFLVSQLRNDPPDLDHLAELLDALLVARDQRGEWAHVSPNLKALERILARPELQWQPQEPSPVAQWIQRQWNRLWELLARLLPDEIPFGGSSALQYALTVLGALALVLVLAYAFRGLRAGFAEEEEIDLEDGKGATLTAAGALKRAQTLSEAGDYRTSVRFLYLSALLLLEERGVLRYDRSLTNREYLRSLAQQPQLASVLSEVVDVFERVWYGYQPIEGAAYRHYAAQVQELSQGR
jgi:hypothetical protein